MRRAGWTGVVAILTAGEVKVESAVLVFAEKQESLGYVSDHIGLRARLSLIPGRQAALWAHWRQAVRWRSDAESLRQSWVSADSSVSPTGRTSAGGTAPARTRFTSASPSTCPIRSSSSASPGCSQR
jgi:hypothetical protein